MSPIKKLFLAKTIFYTFISEKKIFLIKKKFRKKKMKIPEIKKKFRILGTFMNIPSFSEFRRNIPEKKVQKFRKISRNIP